MRALEKICQQLNCLELLKDLEYALSRFGFHENDVAYGAEHLSEWYDLDLPGVRKLLVSYLKEFCAIYEEESIYRIYASVPSPTVLSAALNETGRVRVYTAELCAMIVLRGILGLNIHLLSNPCEGHSRCAMLEHRRGFLKQDFLPEPDLLWSFGLLCDECPKTDEMIEHMQGFKVRSTACPRMNGESVSSVYEDVLRKDLFSVCEEAGVLVPDGNKAWNDAKTLGVLVNSIACVVSGAKTPPLKAATLALLQSTLLMSFGHLHGLLTALRELWCDLRKVKRVGREKKLYCYYISPCLPEFGAIFEKNGIALVGGAAFLTVPLTQPYTNDLAGYCAASWQSCILSRSTRLNAELTAAMVSKYHCDGYLTGMFEFDRWLGAGHKLTAAEIEKRSGKPVLQCHVDFWGRDFSPVRTEVYAETVAQMIDAQRELK